MCLECVLVLLPFLHQAGPGFGPCRGSWDWSHRKRAGTHNLNYQSVFVKQFIAVNEQEGGLSVRLEVYNLCWNNGKSNLDNSGQDKDLITLNTEVTMISVLLIALDCRHTWVWHKWRNRFACFFNPWLVSLLWMNWLLCWTETIFWFC